MTQGAGRRDWRPTVALTLLAALIVGGAYFYARQAGWVGLESEARDALAYTLKDAPTAQFRKLSKDSLGTICGEVNARNGFGAYTGYRQFYAWRGTVFIDSDDSPLKSAANMCGRKI